MRAAPAGVAHPVEPYAKPATFSERFADAARREGVDDVRHATPTERDKLGRLVAQEAPQSAPLYGYAGAEANRLGGVDRYWALRTLAKE